MQLPHSKARQAYIERIKIIESNLKDATTGEKNDTLLRDAQKRLDDLAEKYQYSEEIGTARYKLYELQALVHYFNGNDDDAFDFINQAIEIRGDNYTRAEKLKSRLHAKTPETSAADTNDMTKQQKRKKLIGLEGWLALFIVGQFLALALTIFHFFSDGFFSSSDINTLNKYQTGLGDSIRSLTMFENFAIFVYIALIILTLVLLYRKSKLAKPIAITTLIFVTVYGIIDYTIASSLFDNSGLTQYVQPELDKYAGDVGRAVVAAVIWIPYFLVSKRVKATLTR